MRVPNPRRSGSLTSALRDRVRVAAVVGLGLGGALAVYASVWIEYSLRAPAYARYRETPRLQIEFSDGSTFVGPSPTFPIVWG